MKIVSKLAFTVIVAALFIGSAATEALCLESGKAFPPFGTLFFSFSPSKVDDKSQGIGGEMQINIKKADFPFTFLSFPRSSVGTQLVTLQRHVLQRSAGVPGTAFPRRPWDRC